MSVCQARLSYPCYFDLDPLPNDYIVSLALPSSASLWGELNHRGKKSHNNGQDGTTLPADSIGLGDDGQPLQDATHKASSSKLTSDLVLAKNELSSVSNQIPHHQTPHQIPAKRRHHPSSKDVIQFSPCALLGTDPFKLSCTAFPSQAVCLERRYHNQTHVIPTLSLLLGSRDGNGDDADANQDSTDVDLDHTASLLFCQFLQQNQDTFSNIIMVNDSVTSNSTSDQTDGTTPHPAPTPIHALLVNMSRITNFTSFIPLQAPLNPLPDSPLLPNDNAVFATQPITHPGNAIAFAVFFIFLCLFFLLRLMDAHDRLYNPHRGRSSSSTRTPSMSMLYEPVMVEQPFDPIPDTLPIPPPAYHPATYVDMRPPVSPPPYRHKSQDEDGFSIRSAPI